MNDFEEALRNIDVFCKVLVNKIVGSDETENSNITLEPMEHLLYKKYIISEQVESNPISKNFIPLPQLEEPLIDIFEEDRYVRILMQCRCKEQKVTIHPSIDGLEICKRECHVDSEGTEVCVDKCQKINVPVKELQIEDMTVKCSNNEVFEVTIPRKSYES
ncbi:MAG: hypothetical protein QHH18_06065 [Candidatus Bathyarchaeota archaeon]|jgi:hypothetical protein|nr:hypothetical protein [Candidatus Bathyarchaeota archaeon A05DMB-5]MDH7558154.1 hypothetical protein [Candidatus Bathyarchaeota archaeon]